jgi:hypothetical protein
MRTTLILTLAAIAAGAPTSLCAQLPGLGNGPSESALAAWSALLGTPTGALVPLLTPTMVGIPARSAQLAFRYGHVGGGDDLASLNNFAVTALFPAGTGSAVSLTAGMIRASCDGCDTHLMLSIGGDVGLYSSPLGPSSDAGRFTVALNGELGYGKPSEGTLIAGAVGMPFSLILGSSGMRFVPYVTPAFGFGSSSEGGSSVSGVRFLLGGGIGLYNPESTVSVHGGFQQIFIGDAKMLFGLGLSIGGR